MILWLLDFNIRIWLRKDCVLKFDQCLNCLKQIWIVVKFSKSRPDLQYLSK